MEVGIGREMRGSGAPKQRHVCDPDNGGLQSRRELPVGHTAPLAVLRQLLATSSNQTHEYSARNAHTRAI